MKSIERGTYVEPPTADGFCRRLCEKQYKLDADSFIDPGGDSAPEPTSILRNFDVNPIYL